MIKEITRQRETLLLVGSKDNCQLGQRSRLLLRLLFSCHQNSALCCFDNVALVPLCERGKRHQSLRDSFPNQGSLRAATPTLEMTEG
jgi:hypothetical protein